MSIPTRLTVMLRDGTIKANLNWFTLSYGADLTKRDTFLNRLREIYNDSETMARFVPFFEDIVTIEMNGFTFDVKKELKYYNS